MKMNNHSVFVSFSFKDQLIAENIVNQLFNKYGITYWICTREIRGGENYKKEIIDAISAAKILLLIQSKNSIASEEVPKEVSKALKENKVIIPFVIDDAELEGALEYDLLSIHHIDATKPTLDERIEELARQIYAIIESEKGNDKRNNGAWSKIFNRIRLLPTPLPIPKKVFHGRDKCIEEIKSRFDNGEYIQFVHGIGGIGKTQIVKNYAKQYKNYYDTIIFATYNENLKTMIINDAPFTLEPPLERYILSDGSKESDDDYFIRKLNVIKTVTKGNTLIIIDNFDVEYDEHLKDITNGKYHILFTSRCDYSRIYPTIKVEEIDSIDVLKRIFMENYQGYDVDVDDPHLVALIELVNRHTYTVELLAQHMECSGQTPLEMINALKKEGVLSINKEVQNEETKKEVAYENLLKMFKLFSLTNNEKKVLMFLTFAPSDGINVRLFRELAELDSNVEIKSLDVKGWISKNTAGIALHPIIKDVIKYEIPATKENCKNFVQNFSDLIDWKKSWRFKKEEKEKFVAVAKEILKRFNTIDEEFELLYDNAETLFNLGTEPELAVRIAHRLYEYYYNKYGESSFKVAQAAFKLGWLYCLNTQLSDSLKNAQIWLLKADKLFRILELKNTDELSRHTLTMNNLVRTYLKMYAEDGEIVNYNMAEKFALDALRQAIQSFPRGDYHYAKIAGVRLCLAEVFLNGRKLDDAIEQVNEAIDLLLEIYDDNDVDLMLAYFIKGSILFEKSDYSLAIELAKKSAMGYIEFFGLRHPRVYKSHELLGDCYNKLGMNEEMTDAYVKAENVAKLVFGPSSIEVEEIRKKLSM